MRHTWTGPVLGLVILLLAAGCCCPQTPSGCGAIDDDGDEREDGEQAVPLDEVPAHVLEAARGAVPGIVFEEAEREIENGVVVYELAGTAGGVAFEVEVAADGKVLEVERDGDDGDAGDDDA